MNLEFKNHPEVVCGMSERKDGSMVWYNKFPVYDSVLANREKFFNDLGIDPSTVIAGGSAHKTDVRVVGNDDAGEYLPYTDVMITQDTNIVLSVTGADCMPVMFFDPRQKAVGVVHAGWKGLVAGILENTVKAFTKTFGSDPRDIQVIIGHHIKVCHFEIGEELLSKFDATNTLLKDGSYFADMTTEAKMRLNKAGVTSIKDGSLCTYCNADTLFSFRYDKKYPVKGIVAYVGIKTA